MAIHHQLLLPGTLDRPFSPMQWLLLLLWHQCLQLTLVDPHDTPKNTRPPSKLYRCRIKCKQLYDLLPMFSVAIWSSTLWALCQSAQNMPLVLSILSTSSGSKEGWSMQVGLVYLCLLMTKIIGVNIEWISEMFLHPNLPWCDLLRFACSSLTERSCKIYRNVTLCPSSTECSCVTVTWLCQGCLLFIDRTPLCPRLPWCNSFGFACSLLTERPCAHVYSFGFVCSSLTERAFLLRSNMPFHMSGNDATALFDTYTDIVSVLVVKFHQNANIICQNVIFKISSKSGYFILFFHTTHTHHPRLSLEKLQGNSKRWIAGWMSNYRKLD